MEEHRYFLPQVKKYYSFITLSLLMHINVAQAETALGQGIYYDNQQISKLAQTYPSRVSKDAGYPLINDYSTLKKVFRGSQFGLANKPITTGMWWTPLLSVDKPAGQIQDNNFLSPLFMISNPLTVSLSDQGIAMGIPLQKANVDAAHIDRGYTNTLDITVTTGDLRGTAPLVADYSDWMVKAQWANNNAPLLTANIIEGSPFIFVEKKNKQTLSYLQFNNSQDAKLLTQLNGASLFKTKNASEGNYHYYAYFSNPNKAASTWKTASGVAIVPVNQGGSGTIVPATLINTNDAESYFTLAAIPAASDAEAAQLMSQLQAYAYTVINNTAISYEYDKASSQVITHFNFTTQTLYSNASVQKQPAIMLYPWQIKNMSNADKAHCLLNDECGSDKGVIQTLKGNMHLYAVPTTSAQTASFATQVPFRGILPVLPNQLSQSDLTKIGSYSFTMPADPHLDSKNPWTDTYATGKLLSREAQLIKIVDACR
ncbi:MAG: hypothetical protein P4L79_17245 [Legionella sp.]|uniref:hypothetical protein n=1 Tax=Legionella sp. TaxID=459 RepID=UPI00284FBD38|nr:hypothetical protein [Legionella sp.]